MAERIIGGDSYRAIALDLNARGITTSRGGLWRALKIPSVVFRKRNLGIREHLGTEYPAEWPAIYDEETAGRLYVASPPTRHSRDSAAVDVSISLKAS